MPEQQQEQVPGKTAPMSPPPDHGEQRYKGHGHLTGKAAVVTGADSGIGRAVTIAFAREGADVVIAYFNEHEDARETARWVEQASRRAKSSITQRRRSAASTYSSTMRRSR